MLRFHWCQLETKETRQLVHRNSRRFNCVYLLLDAREGAWSQFGFGSMHVHQAAETSRCFCKDIPGLIFVTWPLVGRWLGQNYFNLLNSRNVFGREWFLNLHCLKNCISGLRNVAAGHDRWFLFAPWLTSDIVIDLFTLCQQRYTWINYVMHVSLLEATLHKSLRSYCPLWRLRQRSTTHPNWDMGATWIPSQDVVNLSEVCREPSINHQLSGYLNLTSLRPHWRTTDPYQHAVIVNKITVHCCYIVNESKMYLIFDVNWLININTGIFDAVGFSSIWIGDDV